MPWFPQCEAEKGGRQEHQPRGESSTPSGCGQYSIRWAEEGLCTTEESQSATGFGGEVGNVTFPGKVMADSETQKLERNDFFQRIVEKVDGGIF